MMRGALLFLATIAAGIGGYFYWRERAAAPSAGELPFDLPQPSSPFPEPLPPMPLPGNVVAPPLSPLAALAVQMSGGEDPALVLAIIEQESNFNPRAYNPNDPNGGAWGLMQILLPTARDMGFAGPGEGLFDPATNIAVGVAYIGWIRGYLASRGLGGDTSVIAAYNAGVGNVAKGYQNIGYVSAVSAYRETWRQRLMATLA